MMKSIASIYLVGAIMGFGVISAALADDSAKAPSNTAWKISGDLEEACSCRAACPCWFKNVPSRMTCDGVQAVFIRKGKYGKTLLDGLAMAEYVQSPEGKSMFESFGNWNLEHLYIDERATEEQRAALKEIAAHLFPAGAKSREVHYVPIARTIDVQEHTVTIGNIGSFSGHLLSGGYAGLVKVSNPPLADPTHREFLQGQATHLVYTDAGQDWKYKDSNYMFNRFSVDSKEYQKFEAEMARKMAQAGPNTTK